MFRIHIEYVDGSVLDFKTKFINFIYGKIQYDYKGTVIENDILDIDILMVSDGEID